MTAHLILEEGFVRTKCYGCDWQPPFYATRDNVRRHVEETGHTVEFVRETRAVYGKRNGGSKSPARVGE